ncbi:MAG TPA: galactose oxidase-like domain-containing protein [Candidatus Acidoferrum sp.]|nr:galactose oxidase-like domain-containing protein [Candidatus Acidoferrum sp.]
MPTFRICTCLRSFGTAKPLLVVAIGGMFLLTCVPRVAAQASVQGKWQTLPNLMPINPVHSALLHNGRVLIVSGSGNVAGNTNFQAGIFDPATGTVTTQPVNWDMFCNGMVVLADGRAIVNGGTLQYDPFHGELRSAIYDPVSGQFTDAQSMAHGRWYPTVTSLSDATVMTFSGLDEKGGTNSTVEIYTIGSGWSVPYGSPFTPPLYPRMHLLPSGKVFYSGSTTSSRYFDPVAHTWSGVVATTNYSGTRTYGTSVLLPLTPANNYKPVVLIMGGGNPATKTTELIDLSAATPQWAYGPNMSQPRIEMNATILPNGKVLALGGSLNDEDTSTASLNADLYDPASNTFSSAGQNAFARLYHSNSLLLPDATVLFIGGNPARGTYEQHIEIYSPPYLFNADGSAATRPSITGVPSAGIGYGSAFQVQTPDAASISSAVLMRPGAPTHAFDMEQRLVNLSFTTGIGVLNVTAPPNGNIAPQGYYLLFLVNTAGVPSVAQFVQLTPAPADVPPTGVISSPSANVTITAGQSVFFDGSASSDPDGTISFYSWTFPGGNPSTSSLTIPGNVTYNSAGAFTATLTVTDNANLTDPNPPTRTITVNPAPDFSIAVSPASRSATQGGNAGYTVSVSALNGFTDTVNFSVSGLPSGASASFVPASVTGSGSSTLTVTTSASTPVGTYTLGINGATAALSHTVNVSLIVSSAGDFSLSASPTTLQVSRGGAGSDTVMVSALQSFTGTVSLSVSGLPARTSASWNPSAVTGSGSAILTIRANKRSRSGTYNLTITGMSGNLTHSIPLTLVVQ